MATVALTLEQYNDTRVRAALAEQARDETRLGRVANLAPMVQYRVASQALPESTADRGVTGRGFVPGLAVAALRRRQPGGRPRRHASGAARQRAYRARRGGQASEITTRPSGPGSVNTQAAWPLARQS